MKKHKLKTIHIAAIIFLLMATVSILGWIIAATLTIAAYCIHALFFSDHIFYNPASDYHFTLPNATEIEFEINNHQITIHHSHLTNVNSCFIPLSIQTTFWGKFFDPYVEITQQSICSKQYFERGAHGLRYINFSKFLSTEPENQHPIIIKLFACRGTQTHFKGLVFTHESFEDKSALIIAPHADDAELAAFAFYKHQKNVTITTLTAGESEAKQYLYMTKNIPDAGVLKGKLRAWDSVYIPKWAGSHVQAINLGYACSTLKDMHQHQDRTINSKTTGECTTTPYRLFNDIRLPTANTPTNQWGNLIHDLRFILEKEKPELIVTPHPFLDTHPDHQYATRAILEACTQLQWSPMFLCYAVHYQNTDQYPFGPEHTDIALPPHFSTQKIADAIYSVELSTTDITDKICALQMMHDLQRRITWKKKIRINLQRMIGRSSYPYGQDDFFRKAVKNQELFWVMDIESLQSALST